MDRVSTRLSWRQRSALRRWIGLDDGHGSPVAYPGGDRSLADAIHRSDELAPWTPVLRDELARLALSAPFEFDDVTVTDWAHGLPPGCVTVLLRRFGRLHVVVSPDGLAVVVPFDQARLDALLEAMETIARPDVPDVSPYRPEEVAATMVGLEEGACRAWERLWGTLAARRAADRVPGASAGT